MCTQLFRIRVVAPPHKECRSRFGTPARVVKYVQFEVRTLGNQSLYVRNVGIVRTKKQFCNCMRWFTPLMRSAPLPPSISPLHAESVLDQEQITINRFEATQYYFIRMGSSLSTSSEVSVIASPLRLVAQGLNSSSFSFELHRVVMRAKPMCYLLFFRHTWYIAATLRQL